MRRLFQLIALAVAIGSIAFWGFAGANRGWTKTSVPQKTLDEVTGIEGITYEKRFVPGVDFLAGAVAGAVVLAGLSFLFRKSNQTQN